MSMTATIAPGGSPITDTRIRLTMGCSRNEHNNDCRTAAEFHSLEGVRGAGGFLIQPVSGVHHRVSGVLGNPLGIPQYKQHGNGAEHQEDDKPYKEAGIESRPMVEAWGSIAPVGELSPPTK